MSETTASLDDRIDYDEKVSDGYVFYREDDTRFTLRLTYYGYMMEAGDVRFHVTEIRLDEFSMVKLYNDGSLVSSIQSRAIPDDMFEALKIIVNDN